MQPRLLHRHVLEWLIFTGSTRLKTAPDAGLRVGIGDLPVGEQLDLLQLLLQGHLRQQGVDPVLDARLAATAGRRQCLSSADRPFATTPVAVPVHSTVTTVIAATRRLTLLVPRMPVPLATRPRAAAASTSDGYIPLIGPLSVPGTPRISGKGAPGVHLITGYADVLGPDKGQIFPRDPSGATGVPTGLVRDAHAAGLDVVPYTIRAENQFLPAQYRVGTDPNAFGNVLAELADLFAVGVDGVFADQPDIAVAARDAYLAQRSGAA